jgi:hypothetical protein
LKREEVMLWTKPARGRVIKTQEACRNDLVSIMR